MPAMVRSRTSLLHPVTSALPLILAVLFVAAWEVFTRYLYVKPFLIPTFSGVISALFNYPQLLLGHFAYTLEESLLGMFLGTGLALGLGALMERYSVLDLALKPLIVALQAFPKEALAPIFLIWFGFGILPKTLVAATICFFPFLINALDGFRAADPSLIELFRSYGASPMQIFVKLKLPMSVPMLYAGAKTAASLSVIGAVVGEFVGSEAGLGYLIRVANSESQTELAFAALLLLGLMGIGLYSAVSMSGALLLRKYLNP